ncbi:MAG: hypothetical protein JWL82_502 [Parcubacteria group bacterium]|nr:hypothetical protein [Parcubacteria group bacterium]
MTAIAFLAHPEKGSFATLAKGKEDSSIPHLDYYVKDGFRVEAIVILNTESEGIAALAALVKLESAAADATICNPSILLLFREIFMEGRKSAPN